MDELLRYTRAILALQIQALQEADQRPKLEVGLARAGLSAREIAGLLGKTTGAVEKTIQRAGTTR